MKGTPKVTVLMPVYNGEKYIQEAIESILNQKFHDFEFLIVDDGSTDHSVDIVASYNDERIRVVRSDQNKGLIHSLNSGIEMARGDYIVRMDCDDISAPHRLEEQVMFMDRHAEVGICGTWVRFFPDEHHFIWKLPKEHEGIVSRLFFDTAIAHPSVIMRKDVLLQNKLRYDPEFRHAEDFDLWVRASRHTRLANISKVMLYYRISPTQICHVHHGEQREKAARIRESQLNLIGIFPDDEQRRLHESIARCEFTGSDQDLVSVEGWLTSIREANIRTSIYPEPFFSEQVLNVWFQACLNLAHSGNCTFSRMLRSPLSVGSGLSIVNKGLLLARWIAGTRSKDRS